MALMDIKVPDIGDFDEVAVIELLVKPGDTIQPEQSLITVESDKASMEIPSSHGGVVKELKVKLGDKVSEGSVVLVLEASEGAAAPAVAPAAAPAPVAAPAAPVVAPPPASSARPTSNATWLCSAAARVAIRPPSAPPTSASRSWWSSVTPPWAAFA